MLDSVIECARGAGQTALQYFRHEGGIEVENKLNDSDIVTIADKASEAYIKKYAAQHFPTHGILSEESTESIGSEDYRWVVDPVDGTTNFFAGIPFWAVSIGVEHHGKREIGVVYVPALDEMFYAQRGHGAYLNGRRIHVSGEQSLSRSVIATGFPVDKDVSPDNNMDNLAVVLPKVRDIRRLGSAATDMCYVAAGFMQGYWELKLHEWDVNAATLILEEAGGTLTRFREWNGVEGICIVCGNRSIHDKLLSLIR